MIQVPGKHDSPGGQGWDQPLVSDVGQTGASCWAPYGSLIKTVFHSYHSSISIIVIDIWLMPRSRLTSELIGYVYINIAYVSNLISNVHVLITDVFAIFCVL